MVSITDVDGSTNTEGLERSPESAVNKAVRTGKLELTSRRIFVLVKLN